MKKLKKVLVLMLVYVVAFTVTSLWVNRIQKLESIEDYKSQNEKIVLEVK